MKRRKSTAVVTVCAGMAVLAGLDVLAFLSGSEHHGGFWNSVPLGDLALGALGAAGLVWFARRILKRFLTRPESYYDGVNSRW